MSFYGQQSGYGYPGQTPQPSGYPGQVPPGYGVQQTHQMIGGQQPYNPAYTGQPGGYGQPPGINPTVMSWFRAVDQDNSGQINAGELRQALQNGSWSQFSMESCRLMISMFDHDHTGTIDVSEFSQLFEFINRWTEVYRKYDTDMSGTIDERELNSALQQMGYRLSPQFVSFIVAKFNPKERRMTLDNFIVVNVQLRNLTEGFKARDKEMKGIISVAYEDFLSMAFASFM